MATPGHQNLAEQSVAKPRGLLQKVHCYERSSGLMDVHVNKSSL